jgi:glutamine synthetase
LKDVAFSLEEDVLQEDTDRNRTSPYAYTGHKFEFRALGASQNPSFPMAVITATLANEVDLAIKKLNSGYSVD